MAEPASELPARDEHIAPAPRISIQAFCESVETAAAVQAAGEDRRLGKAHLKIQMGGMAAASEAYRGASTPNVIVLEFEQHSDAILNGLDSLADVCDPGTRVIVIGRHNDVTLYRELVRRGVSDYLIAPVRTLDIVRAICGLYSAPDAKKVGRILAVIGAKGGVGASTVAHNVAWSIARDLNLDSVVTDLDLAFGTAGLDYNQDPPQGIADAVFSPERIDNNFVDRLLSKCSENLSLLAAPATLDRVYDFGAEAFDAIFDSLRATVPSIVLDVPHQWTGWTQRTLLSADDILIVASPDLANLRNAKNFMDYLKTARVNDHRPFYVLNQVGIPKRPEIKPADFAKALDDDPAAIIPFEPQIFGTAANNGQMIAEVAGNHKVAETFRELAQLLTGRSELKKPSNSLFGPLLQKFRSKK
ncbi:MAG: AAA family ATPase [Pseudorhodoplanes sp.]